MHLGSDVLVSQAEPYRCRSYLQFVPSLYGTSEVITAAANCLLGKAKAVLTPNHPCRELNLRLYAKALRSLQTAIQNQDTCSSADVLCATQLLSLHEVDALA